MGTLVLLHQNGHHEAFINAPVEDAAGCHASQVGDASFFMQMSDEVFLASFGTEWFIHVGAPAGIHEDWLAGLA